MMICFLFGEMGEVLEGESRKKKRCKMKSFSL